MEKKKYESPCVIGIDIGTQGVKGALFDSRGKCIAEHSETSSLIHPEPNATEERPGISVCLFTAGDQGKSSKKAKISGSALRILPL